MNLPTIGHALLAFSYHRDTLSKFDVVPVFSKKMIKFLLWDNFTKAVDGTKGSSAADACTD